MSIICTSGRNVNSVFPRVVRNVFRQGKMSETRNGPAMVPAYPTVTEFYRPYERVLFDPTRNANPFFHLIESFWMLAGRRDAAMLNTYIHDFGDRFAEDDGILWGAYGDRWRNWGVEGTDQLVKIIEMLRRNSSDRRAVLSMWDPSRDLGANKKDIPCNTTIYFRVTQAGTMLSLDMTVCCRSNDVVWGLCGANAVHFSVLQEFIATQIGALVGTLTVFGNNTHIYTNTSSQYQHILDTTEDILDPYATRLVAANPLFYYTENPENLLSAIHAWTTAPTEIPKEIESCGADNTVLFESLLIPAERAHALYRQRNYDEALRACQSILSTDWSFAMHSWIVRRDKANQEKIRREQLRQWRL